jgi:hypothetical protein
MEGAKNCYALYFIYREKISEDRRPNFSVACLIVSEIGNLIALNAPAIRLQQDERQVRNVERREMCLLRG